MKASLVVLLLSCAHLIDGKFPAWSRGNANWMFDNLLVKLKHLDGVASRMAIVKAGNFNIKHGRISEMAILGLDSVSRSGSVTAVLVDDRAVIEANIGVWDIRIVGFLQLPILNIAGEFLVREPHVRCRVRFTFSINKMHLNNFEILDMSQFELWQLRGWGSLNWISRSVVQNELRKMYPYIRSKLERKIEMKLATGLRSLDPFKLACRLFAASLEEDIRTTGPRYRE